ncbi:unnamed protein product [Caenorhabditis brenneri]
MSFSAYCRDCGIHFADPHAKNQLVATVHHGIVPKNPAISEGVFYIINAHVPQVRARTCPVCLVHFSILSLCIEHVDLKHPSDRSTLRPTKEIVIYEWERLVETVFPGSFSLVSISIFYSEKIIFLIS